MSREGIESGVAWLHLGPFAERAWAEWGVGRGWSWRPRLMVLIFAGLAVGGLVVHGLGGIELEPIDLWKAGLAVAFLAHGWAVRGVVQIVASEMEARTLELLLLTRIRPRDLVLGQHVLGLAGSLVAVIGLVPWLWLGWIQSGWGVSVAGWVALVWLMTGVALNSVLLGVASFGRTMSAGGMAGLGVVVLLVATQTAIAGLASERTPAASVGFAKSWILGSGVVVVSGTGLAWWRLSRASRGWAGVRTGRRSWRGKGSRRLDSAVRKRLLVRNPIEWLAWARSPWWAWLVVVGGVVVSWRLGPFAPGVGAEAMAWVRGGLLVLLSFQAYGQHRYDLREGTWEALLRTPVTVNQYVVGHLRAWWRQQGWVLATVAAIPALACLVIGRTTDGVREAGIVLVGSVLLTAADAVLASVWFLGAAVKYDGRAFLFAAALAAWILGLMQIVHITAGRGIEWPCLWAVLATALFLASFRIICREIGEQLDDAAGKPRRKPPGWDWSDLR